MKNYADLGRCYHLSFRDLHKGGCQCSQAMRSRHAHIYMPCKLPFSFCSVRHGAINGYLNKRLCPLLPAVTKTMLTGSQRSIHQQLGFNSGRPPSSIFLATVSMSVHFKNHIWSIYPASYFHPLLEKWARAHPPSQRVRRNRESEIEPSVPGRV